MDEQITYNEDLGLFKIKVLMSYNHEYEEFSCTATDFETALSLAKRYFEDNQICGVWFEKYISFSQDYPGEIDQ